jgi:hypothetical protein
MTDKKAEQPIPIYKPSKNTRPGSYIDWVTKRNGR